MSRAAAPPNATEATKLISSPLELITVNHETNIARPATATAMWVRVEVISLALWLVQDQSAEAQAGRGAVRLGQDHRWLGSADAAWREEARLQVHADNGGL